jgi:hypothetical protein
MGPRAGLDDVEYRKLLTLPGLEFRPLSQSLYRLRYPGFFPVTAVGTENTFKLRSVLLSWAERQRCIATIHCFIPCHMYGVSSV